jgi:hypothetical protein
MKSWSLSPRSLGQVFEQALHSSRDVDAALLVGHLGGRGGSLLVERDPRLEVATSARTSNARSSTVPSLG